MFFGFEYSYWWNWLPMHLLKACENGWHFSVMQHTTTYVKCFVVCWKSGTLQDTVAVHLESHSNRNRTAPYRLHYILPCISTIHRCKWGLKKVSTFCTQLQLIKPRNPDVWAYFSGMILRTKTFVLHTNHWQAPLLFACNHSSERLHENRSSDQPWTRMQSFGHTQTGSSQLPEALFHSLCT